MGMSGRLLARLEIEFPDFDFVVFKNKIGTNTGNGCTLLCSMENAVYSRSEELPDTFLDGNSLYPWTATLPPVAQPDNHCRHTRFVTHSPMDL
jgi:hypothetical protein